MKLAFLLLFLSLDRRATAVHTVDGSCEGRCGLGSADIGPSSCYCDTNCYAEADCCADYETWCSVDREQLLAAEAAAAAGADAASATDAGNTDTGVIAGASVADATAAAGVGALETSSLDSAAGGPCDGTNNPCDIATTTCEAVSTEGGETAAKCNCNAGLVPSFRRRLLLDDGSIPTVVTADPTPAPLSAEAIADVDGFADGGADEGLSAVEEAARMAEVTDTTGHCGGFCGKKSGEACYCDVHCTHYSDCCDDYVETCSVVRPSQIADAAAEAVAAQAA